jgi:4a-hydroxytetrahydrobiopterin dehydratase
MPKLTQKEVRSALTGLRGWKLVKTGKLHREYKFADFMHAFGFMATAALAIERMNHHPEWFNVYNKVVVDLSTHDVGGISEKDIALARILDNFAGRLE